MRQPGARAGHGSPVFGVFVLATGVVLLLNVLGVLSWDIWRELWRWWPLALVLLGAGMLLRRTHPLLMTTVTLGAAAVAVAFSWATVEGKIGSYDTETAFFSEPVGSASSATLDIDFGAGSLNMSSLPTGSNLLIDAALEDREDGVETRVEWSGDDVRVEMRNPADVGWFGPSTSRRNWELALNRDVEFTIDIDGGASSYKLDLREIDASEITIDIGASSVELTVPDRVGLTEVRINGGAASIDITVPEAIAATINIDSGLSSVDVDESRFPKVGPDHVSPDYDTATSRVNIVIAAGVSSISVR